MMNREAYTVNMKVQLDALNTKMDLLEQSVMNAKQDTRDLYNDEIRKLHNESKFAVAKLDELNTATNETWEAMTTEMERVRDTFMHSFHYLKSQI